MTCHENPIDLTADEDEEEEIRQPKRTRVDPQMSFNASIKTPSIFTSHYPTQSSPAPFAGPSSSAAFFPERQVAPRPQVPVLPSRSVPPPHFYQPPQHHHNGDRSSQVIDLTGSTPSPPPRSAALSIEHLPPKTPVCIGQLHATALILYPSAYTVSLDPTIEEWVPVKLEYAHEPHKPTGPDTIHIKTPALKGLNGEVLNSEVFGFVDQKHAKVLGGMLGKSLIRLEGKVKKGPQSHPVLALLLLVYTPKGNIPPVGNFLYTSQLLLDHPTHAADIYMLKDRAYYNPHNPPPGGHNQNRHNAFATANRWTVPAVSGRSVEVQRSQVDELFQSLKRGDDIVETEPAPEIATPLYPHQKKALTFLLEREQEKRCGDGTICSLWQENRNPFSPHKSWIHLVTEKEVFEQPSDGRGAILADDASSIMGLGKTITCLSLIAATMESAKAFAVSPVDKMEMPAKAPEEPEPAQFAGAVWGMPDTSHMGPSNAKAKAKAQREQEKREAEYSRHTRIKTKSRATLIICPLSTISNWEDQLREHWKGEVYVVGGAGGSSSAASASRPSTPSAKDATPSSSTMSLLNDAKPKAKPGRIREGPPLRVYIYHGNARRPDPSFLADFDVVMTTYATLASEYSKQNRSIASAEAEEEGDGVDSDGVGMDIDEAGNQMVKLPKAKSGKKRKKPCGPCPSEQTSALQSIHWFRVVLDEAHSIKEIQTVGSRASCDLMADRRLCLTGTPVQNKLDDVYALIRFLRLSPFDDKNVWTEFIGSPLKFGQTQGMERLQRIMKYITLRRTKESKTQDGRKVLSLPPRRDELRFLQFDSHEKELYEQFFSESKAEFNELTAQNQVMKNYVGILQRILRLRQICDHYELVDGKEVNGDGQQPGMSYESIVAAIEREGLTTTHANAIFNLIRESATTQCCECGVELCGTPESQGDGLDLEAIPSGTPKRPRKTKNPSSRGPTRANSPSSATFRTIMTRCLHLFCISCFRSCVCPGWPEVPNDTVRPCSMCQYSLNQADALEVKAEITAPESSGGGSAKKKTQKREKRPKIAPADFHSSTKIRSLLGDLVQFSKANPYSANYDPSSVEIQMVDDKGNEIDDGIVKTVVFSQWTTMLDKVEDALEVAGIRYDRLDGTMKRDDRTRAMEALKHDPGCEVLLVSLRAGGVGLNLTAAQRVYLMDPYWNPAVENQAVDRIHRLGQTRPVTTVKLIIQGTIEDRLLQVQKMKTELANLTLGGQNFSKAELMQRRLEELKQLFR
uniref:Dna repair protein rad5 n=1 Tax=Moniliophthora roreri TaxID=221103 RepID=A0A0W0FGG1_MONRR